MAPDECVVTAGNSTLAVLSCFILPMQERPQACVARPMCVKLASDVCHAFVNPDAHVHEQWAVPSGLHKVWAARRL